MDRTGARQKLFNRRTALLAGGQLTLFAVLAGRLYDLQVLKGDRYRMLADENRMSMQLLAPRRGEIVDRYGFRLATNRRNHRVLMIAEQVRDIRATLKALGELTPISDAQVELVIKRLKKSHPFVPVTVVENLSWEEFAKFNALLPDFAGTVPDVGDIRHYPMGEAAVHVVGYVSAVSEADLSDDPVLELPGFRIGKNGVEQNHDLVLRGRAGTRQFEVNAYGREIRELTRTDSRPGRNVVSTIDSGLQSYVHRRLSGESAAVAVLDSNNGEILALTSTPAYDPNAFNLGMSAKTWSGLLKNPRAPLTNKAAGGLYPPGSTFKMMVAVAALEDGLIKPEDKVFCNGLYKLGKGRFHCWRAKYGGHGHVNLHKAIVQSCDIYFYDLAKKLGVDRIAETARRFGLGDSFDGEVPGARDGLLPTKGWKQAVIGRKWQVGETLITGIGQGYVTASPLQLAVMTARLASGRIVRPKLVRAVISNEALRRHQAGNVSGTVTPERLASPPLGYSETSLALVRTAMDAVVNSKRGTARRARLDKETGIMAGKTGTSQVRRISKTERRQGIKKNKDRQWIERDHSLFVAYAPVEAPKYAVALVVEHGGSGTYAAQITKDIMSEALRRDPAARAAIGRLAVGKPPPERG